MLLQAGSSGSLRSDGDDLEQIVEAGKVGRIARIKRQICRDGRGGDEQVRRPAAARLSAGRGDRSVHATVRAGHVSIHGEGLERGLGPLQAILAARPFGRI